MSAINTVTSSSNYSWSSTAERHGKAHLEISRREWLTLGVSIHGGQTYIPISLTPEQASQAADALATGQNFETNGVTGYEDEPVTLKIIHESGEIFFIARYKDLFMGNAVSVSQVDEIIEVLRLGAKITELWLAENHDQRHIEL